MVDVRDSSKSHESQSVQPVSNPCPTFASLKPHALTEVSTRPTYIPYKDIFYKKEGHRGPRAFESLSRGWTGWTGWTPRFTPVHPPIP